LLYQLSYWGTNQQRLMF